jgi:hypothetical protein
LRLCFLRPIDFAKNKKADAGPSTQNAATVAAIPAPPTVAERILVPLEVFLETNDGPSITYKRKLRIVLRNESANHITVLSASWRRRNIDDIMIKSQDRYLWQIEEQLGSWENNRWKPEERTEISADPGFTLWTYIGLHDQATDHDVRRRLVQGRLGSLTVVMRIDGKIVEQRISPGPVLT